MQNLSGQKNKHKRNKCNQEINKINTLKKDMEEIDGVAYDMAKAQHDCFMREVNQEIAEGVRSALNCTQHDHEDKELHLCPLELEADDIPSVLATLQDRLGSADLGGEILVCKPEDLVAAKESFLQQQKSNAKDTDEPGCQQQ